MKRSSTALKRVSPGVYRDKSGKLIRLTGGFKKFNKRDDKDRKRKPKSRPRAKEVSIRQSASAAQMIYGRMLVGGVYTFLETSADSKAFLQTGSANDRIVWIARTAGQAGNDITITIVLAGTNPTLTVGNVGDAITVTLKSTAGVSESTANQVIAAVQAHGGANALVSVHKGDGNGSGLVSAVSTTNLAEGGGTHFHQVITLACHEIDAIETLYLDNRAVTLGGDRWATGTFEDKVFMAVMYGTDSQTAQPDLLAQLPSSWTDTDRQRGHAHVYMINIWDEALFESQPEASFLIRGKKCWDPRTGTTVWTRNAALIAADYILTAKNRGGLGAIQADLNISDQPGGLEWAADICDESVSLAGGGTEARYSIDCAFDTDEEPEEILSEMAQAMGGDIVRQNGKFHFFPGVHRSSTMTLTEDDIIGPIQISTKISKRENFNTVRGTYVSSTNNYEETDYPSVKNDTYITEDGQVIPYDINFPMVTSTSQCQRLAKIELERVRQGITVSVPITIKALKAQVGDTIALTLDKYGWSTKLFEVRDMAHVIGGADELFRVELQLRETASGIYDWNSGEETEVDVAPNSNLPSPFDVEEPTNLNLESGTTHLYIRADGTVQPRIYVEWDSPEDVFVVNGGRIRVEYKLNSESAFLWKFWADEPGNKTFSYITDVKEGVSYDVRIQAFNSIGAYSSHVVETAHVVVGKTAPPSDVTGLTATKSDFGIIVFWDAISDLDRNEYELRVGANWAAGTVLYRGKALNFRWEHKVAGTYHFMVKAIDTTGNVSTTEDTFDLTINAPGTPTLSHSIVGPDAVFAWTTPSADFAIKEYEIRYGASYAAGTPVAIVTANNYILQVNWGGARTFYVKARDIAGNESSTAGSTEITIENPNPPETVTTETIRNNVAIDWYEPAITSLPIARYKLYRGAAFDGAEFIGSADKTFDLLLEKSPGLKQFWVVTQDTAGNLSTATASPLTQVVVPDDFFILEDVELIAHLKDPGDDYPYEGFTSYADALAIFDPEREVLADNLLRISQIGDVGPAGNNATQSTDANKPVLSRADNKENWILYSEAQQSGSAWFPTRLTATDNQAANPIDGAVTASTLIEDTSTNTHYIQGEPGVAVGSGSSHRFVVRVKPNGRTTVALRFSGTAYSGNPTGYFDISTGALNSSTGLSNSDITDLGDGWYECVIEAVASAAGTFVVQLMLATGAGTTSYTGDGTSGIYSYGYQVQTVSADNTYLATTTFRYFRGINGNRCAVFDGTNDYLLANGIADDVSGDDIAHEVIAVIQLSRAATPNGTLINFGDSAQSTQKWHDYYLGSTYLAYRRGDTGAAATASAGTTSTSTAILSYTFTGTNLTLRVNGAIVINNASLNTGTVTFNRVGIGAYVMSTLGDYFLGKIGFMAVYNRVLTTDEREELEDMLLERFTDPDYLPTSCNYLAHIQGEPASRILYPVEPTRLEGSWPVGTYTRRARWSRDDIFRQRGWDTEQDAIDEGYTSILQPTNDRGGRILFEVDHGAVLPTAAVTFSWAETHLGPTPRTLTPGMEFSPDGTTWTVYAGYSQAFVSNFRYARYYLDFPVGTDYEVGYIEEMNATLEVPKDEDNIRITANSGDAGGTLVNFTKTFLDVQDIQVSVNSDTDARAAYDYDFASDPQDQFLYVLVWDGDGNRATKEVTVRVRGAVIPS